MMYIKKLNFGNAKGRKLATVGVKRLWMKSFFVCNVHLFNFTCHDRKPYRMNDMTHKF